MENESRPSREGLSRQVKQQIDSLKAAGVEWVALPETSSSQGITRSTPGQGSLLFHEPAPAEAVPPAEDRRKELKLLADRITGCTRCEELVATRSRTVFGVGPLDVDLCFVGEGPGQTEDRQGEPFVGDAGLLLNRIITACGMKREEVYICNIVKCRPPGNRTPTPEEAGHCREHLTRQLELVRPKFLCALGACAAQNLLDTRLPIGRLRGRFHDYRGIPVLCTYHPAYLLRSPEKKKDVWEDLKVLLERMGKPVPAK